ncbi:Crp/Fnr family transcriptional regulator [Arsenicibacter rosenii]|uniref:Cyclic nucleotide-binding protein n=1 Tax=Arsenicibacter rosenii TaxID=1750698 RepID=A0A1S2VAE5_9BACT|nr:Crp/Fnr family transcriptional regulator [Arsenicibacter rosenii]OIN55681.1 cyclic nucleotide-binding protein [Arsenicibacter rosenii]
MHEQLSRYINRQIKVSEEELNTILSYFRPLTLTKNELVVTHGQTSQRTYFVGKGCLRVFFIDDKGQEATRYFAFENQFATALVSFITGEASEEFIQATELTKLLYISHHDFYHLLDTIPQWEKFYRYYLENAYVNNTKRLMSFLVQDAAEKYRMLLAENPVIVRRLSNKLVASYLNISQETLSRLKAKVK